MQPVHFYKLHIDAVYTNAEGMQGLRADLNAMRLIHVNPTLKNAFYVETIHQGRQDGKDYVRIEWDFFR